ncbi:hypothetical protein D3C72_1998990 [compost metagenome]
MGGGLKAFAVGDAAALVSQIQSAGRHGPGRGRQGLDLFRPHPAQFGVIGAQGIGQGLAHDGQATGDDLGGSLGGLLSGAGGAGGAIDGVHAGTVGLFRLSSKRIRPRFSLRAGLRRRRPRRPGSAPGWRRR